MPNGSGCWRDARHYERSQSDNWQVRGLSGRPVLLQMGTYQPVTFISGREGWWA
jgi:hypothetical protein